MKSEDEIRLKLAEIKDSEISVRANTSFQLYAVKLLEWVLE